MKSMKSNHFFIILIILVVIASGCQRSEMPSDFLQQPGTILESVRTEDQISYNGHQIPCIEGTIYHEVSTEKDDGISGLSDPIIEKPVSAIRIASTILTESGWIDNRYIPFSVTHDANEGIWLVSFLLEQAPEDLSLGGDVSIALNEKNCEVLWIENGE